MLISSRKKFIFIHIYKTAGTSMLAALWPHSAGKMQLLATSALRRLRITPPFEPQCYPDHITAAELVARIGRETFDKYFSFAIVRNPWDWQVSLYHFAVKHPAHGQHKLFKSFANFDTYVRWRCRLDVRQQQQKDFICSADGEQLVDFVGRLETIDRDFATICSRIGIEATLPTLNVSNTKPYRSFYSDETAELVRKTFETDIVHFGYEF
jgi:hypothetical protein